MLYSGQDAMVIVLIAGVRKTLSEDCNSLAQCPLSGVSKLDHPDQGRMFSATSLWTWLFSHALDSPQIRRSAFTPNVVGGRTTKQVYKCTCCSAFVRALATQEGSGPVRNCRFQQDRTEPFVFICDRAGEDRPDKSCQLNRSMQHHLIG